MNKSQLMLPIIKEKNEALTFGPSSGSNDTLMGHMPVTFEQLTEWVQTFCNYELDTIEVHVKGVANTTGVTQLFIGLSGEAGMKLILKKPT